MNHFILEPNYSLLKDHLFSHLNDDEWQRFLNTYNGKPMQMASFIVSTDGILQFQHDFIDTLAGIGEDQQDRSDYNLIEHFHNLLTICLYAYEDFYATMEYYNDSYQSEVCLKELAQMLLLYENNPDRSIV
ncbi:hypothetical protein [Solitalea lacus]|uniref:hypothetical protein n=1 Tax=Solitalea lacus TaxID=2911172 RepID=UPI001EDA34EC|nr:hypothetical protein [Solitalea lacus]UKJ07799.1 hypothetical protein L2B55_01215 [Solitalea lacus]